MHRCIHHDGKGFFIALGAVAQVPRGTVLGGDTLAVGKAAGEVVLVLPRHVACLVAHGYR